MNDKKLVYTDEFELFLKQEGEKAEGMAILHYKSYEWFNFLSVLINVPVIVLSSIVGFLSPIPLFTDQALALGALSICISILKVCDNYFDITKLSERHRSVSLQYTRITKWIQIQLCLEREVRISANDLFEMITSDLSNIRDSEPIIPQAMIDEFNLKYQGEETARPSITNGLTVIQIYQQKKKEQENLIVEPKVADKKPVFKV